MKIFIAGASGLIGGNCLTLFKEAGHNCIGSHFNFATPYTAHYDTLRPDNPDNFNVAAFAPEVIVHCGALTHVDYCESHVEESYQKTVVSTQNLADCASQLGARFVFLSTDYVFDGKAGPYTEAAETHPLSVYARHKWEAELEALKIPGALILRVTNVYGRELRNKNFVMRLAEAISKGEKLDLRLPSDQYATPINARDVARAMLQLLEDQKTGIYHLASTDFMNRVQLAQRVSEALGGVDTLRIAPVATAQLGQPAPRPLLGGLIAAKFLSEYPEFKFSNHDDFLIELKG
jgi:dTDP-4-dehydrorhamnose reductase